MKIYGYTKANESDLQEMSEISLQGSYEQLVKISQFILKYAEVMKREGNRFEHAHIKDDVKEWDARFPEIIVSK
ncbi:MAG: hypothetical protein ABI041_05565 [Bdellovibrionia bacterium]